MKDPTHHRGYLQKQILRSSRRDALLSQSTSIQTSATNLSVVGQNRVDDHDTKRKMPLQYVRHTPQRQSMH